MKINLIDVNEFIKENNCLEVTNPVYFSGNKPTEDGLFSTRIFGDIGTSDRKTKFGYINLNSKFLQPIIYKILISLDKRIDNIIRGSNYYSINSKGELVEDEQSGDTGLDFLYKNIKNIKFKESSSDQRRKKIDIINKLSPDQLFTDKFLVIPAFLRDYNPGSSDSIMEVDECNDVYSKIIRISSNLSSSTFGFIANNSKYQVQNLLLDLYTQFTEGLAHKKGIIRRSLMGKSVDYATRSVITAPKINSKTYDKIEIKFGYTGIPLSQLVTLFYPFFVKYIEDFIKTHEEELTRLKDKNGEDIYIDNIYEQFSTKGIQKLLENFIKNIEGRFDSIKVKDKEGNLHNVYIYNEQLGHNFTLTDLIYIAAVDICADKHVYVTRYPIENLRTKRFPISLLNEMG